MSRSPRRNKTRKKKKKRDECRCNLNLMGDPASFPVSFQEERQSHQSTKKVTKIDKKFPWTRTHRSQSLGPPPNPEIQKSGTNQEPTTSPWHSISPPEIRPTEREYCGTAGDSTPHTAHKHTAHSSDRRHPPYSMESSWIQYLFTVCTPLSVDPTMEIYSCTVGLL